LLIYDGAMTRRRFALLGLLLPCSFPLALLACGDAVGTTTTAAASSGSAGGAGGAPGTGGAGGGGLGGDGPGGGLGTGGFMPIPVKDLPGLGSITFWERTGGDAPTPYEFIVDGPELTNQLPDPLTDASRDISGATGEFYDVYYSDGDGVFQAEGSYLTISGVFGQALPAGGGLNLAEIGLNFTDASTEYGNYVASYVVLGDNSAEANVGNCIDGDLQTHTTMGNTIGSTERLRLTLGFESTSGVPR
jgi:hypothetical protein